MSSITALSGYSSAVDATVLTLSNGLQVRPHADIYRVDGLRLYAYGTYNYQNDIRSEWRACLLIDGLPTVEWDFPALHFNMCLNWEGLPSDDRVYETVLAGLGLKPTKTKRSAMKLAVLAALNAENFDKFRKACDDARDGESISRAVGRTPRKMLDSMKAAYPALGRYACTDKNFWRRLHKADSDIMIDILSILAGMGIVALPVHDSVIVQGRHGDAARQVMEDCYKLHMGFKIDVK